MACGSCVGVARAPRPRPLTLSQALAGEGARHTFPNCGAQESVVVVESARFSRPYTRRLNVLRQARRNSFCVHYWHTGFCSLFPRRRSPLLNFLPESPEREAAGWTHLSSSFERPFG